METIASSDRCVCNRIPCRQWCSACRFRVLHGVSVGAVVWVGPGVDVVVGVDQFFRAASLTARATTSGPAAGRSSAALGASTQLT